MNNQKRVYGIVFKLNMKFNYMLQLTPRQKTLKERLERFCSRVNEECIPLNIEEIWGFGSFFRLKNDPGDIDLCLKYSSRNKIYDRFKQILDKAILQYSRSSYSPKEAFLNIAKIELTENESKKMLSIFIQWIECYTWNIIFSGLMSIPETKINPEEITKRILLRDLKKIQIPFIVSREQSFDGLVANHITLVWHKEHGDASINWDVVLSPEKVRSARITELKNFENQIYPDKIEYEIILVLVKYVRRLKAVKMDSQDHDEMLEKKAQRSFPMISEKILKQVIKNVRMFYPEKLTGLPHIEYTNLKNHNIKDLVETKRLELKNIQKTLVVARQILHSLYWCKCNIQNERTKSYSQEELVALDVIESIPKKKISEKKIRETLRILKFPESHIVKENRMWSIGSEIKKI